MKIPPPLYVVTGLWHGKKREAISLPCSRLKAVELRDWTRRTFQNINVYVDIQIRDVYFTPCRTFTIFATASKTEVL